MSTRVAILLILCLGTGTVAGQMDNCYSVFMDAGDKAVSRASYTLAAQYYEAARQCTDITAVQDSVAQAAYVDAYDTWTRQLSAALGNADRMRALAVDARDSLSDVLIESERLRKEAIAARLEAERRANEAEAKRFALISAEYLDSGEPEAALAASLEAISYDSLSADVYRAFGNAAFQYYHDTLPKIAGGIMQIHFDNAGGDIAARGQDVMYQKVQNHENFFENNGTAYDAIFTKSHGVLFATDSAIVHLNPETGSESIVWGSKHAVSHLLENDQETFIVAATRDMKLYGWNSNVLGQTPIVFEGHEAPIKYLEFSAGGKTFLSRALDKTVRVWSNDGALLAEVRHDAFIHDAHFSQDGQHIVSADASGTVNITTVSTGGVRTMSSAHDGPIVNSQFLNNTSVITASLDGSVTILDLEGSSLHELSTNSPVKSVDLDRKKEHIVVLLEDNTIVVCDNVLSELTSWNPCQSESILATLISPNGKYVLTSHSDMTTHLWSIEGQEVMTPESFSGDIWGAGFSPDGTKIWASSKDGVGWSCELPDRLLQRAEALPPSSGNY